MTESERRARFERALEYGGRTHTVADVARMIREGTAQFWQRGDGMIVTEVNEFPLFKAVRFWIVAGELKACLGLQPEIDAWARGEGCTVATAMGRKGWGRAAPGWKPGLPNFFRELDT